MEKPRRRKGRWQFGLGSLLVLVGMAAFAIWPWPKGRGLFFLFGFKVLTLTLAGQMYFAYVADRELSQRERERSSDFAFTAGVIAGLFNFSFWWLVLLTELGKVNGANYGSLCLLPVLGLACLTGMAFSWAFDRAMNDATAMMHLCAFVGMCACVGMYCGGFFGDPGTSFLPNPG